MGGLCLVRDEQKQETLKKGASGIEDLEEYSIREIVLLDIIIWYVT